MKKKQAMTINHCKKINQNVIGWVTGCDGIMGDIPPIFITVVIIM